MSTAIRIIALSGLLAGEGCMARSAWTYDETHRIAEVMRADRFTEATPGAQGIALLPQAYPMAQATPFGSSSANRGDNGYQLSSMSPSGRHRNSGSGYGGYGSSSGSGYRRSRSRNTGNGYNGYSGYSSGGRRRTRRKTAYRPRPRRAYPSTYLGLGTNLNLGANEYGMGDWNTFDSNCFCML